MSTHLYGYMPSGRIFDEEGQIKKTHVLKQVLSHEKKYLPVIILSFLLAISSVVFTLLVPIRIGNAIDLISSGTFDGTLLFTLGKVALYAILAGLTVLGVVGGGVILFIFILWLFWH